MTLKELIEKAESLTQGELIALSHEGAHIKDCVEHELSGGVR